jgi:hypothetical protein
MTPKERRNLIKQQLLTQKGGKCSKCGFNETPSALAFHHVDRKTKKFSVSGTNLIGKSRRAVQQEADKCVVLCLNCHALAHDKEGWTNN